MIENHFDYEITRKKIAKAFDVKPGHPAYSPICAFLDYYDKDIREQYSMKQNLEKKKIKGKLHSLNTHINHILSLLSQFIRKASDIHI